MIKIINNVNMLVNKWKYK